MLTIMTSFMINLIKENFYNNLEKIQYNTALAIIGPIKGKCKLKIYEVLGLESLKFRRWMHHLCVFYKIKTRDQPEYLTN